MSVLTRRFELGTPGANRPVSLVSIINPLNGRRVTKGDGFIWIKRKHYFQPDLNTSFFKR